MEKFFSAAGFPGSGGMEREQEHARGRDEGMERSRSAQPGCLHTRSEKGTAGRQWIIPRSARGLILEGPEHRHPFLIP